MDLTNEIIEQYGFKRMNNSTWRKGNWTLRNGWTHEGVTLYDKIFNTKKAYKLCIDGKYLQMITTVELFESLLRGREVDAGIIKCNKHIVNISEAEVCEICGNNQKSCGSDYCGNCIDEMLH